MVRSSGVALILLAVTAAWAAYAPGRLLCRFADPQIPESSGVAASGRSDAYFFTHNDSGDTARIFAVDLHGRTLATLRVPNAKNVDWEDMAATRNRRGNPVLYLADIGDNNAKRTEVFLYRIPEPTVDAGRPGQKASTAPAERFELRYPDGPKDAETLLVFPGDRVFVVSKNPAGSAVYAAPGTLQTGKPNRLRKIGDLNFVLLPTAAKSLRMQVGRLLATGGSVAPDGKRMVVRTYADAYEWDVANEDVAAAFKTKPRHIPLPETRQGEGIGYTRDGRSLLTTSEGKGSPVYLLNGS